MRNLALPVALALSALCSAAQAQQPDPHTARRLAQLFISEAGPTATADHVAIYHVLRTRQAVRGDATLLDTIHAYTAGRLLQPETDRQRWIAELDWSGRRPEHFPPNLSWERFAPRWKDMLRRAMAFLRSPPPNPCPEARHWGGRNIDPPQGRMVRVCAHVPTRNRLYAVNP